MRTALRGLVFAVALGCSGFALAPSTASARPPAGAHATVDYAVGTLLAAREPVKLAQAQLVRGSKVTVTARVEERGKVVAFDLALADGHVVKRVPHAKVASAFEVTQ